MIIVEQDLQDIPKILGAVQVFQDNQIRCKDDAADVMRLREPSNNRAIEYLEAIVGHGNVSNKTLRKVLNGMHEQMVAGAKSGLQIYG